ATSKGITRFGAGFGPLDDLSEQIQFRSSSVLSQDVQIPAERPRAVFYTNESDPANHTEHHEGRHYSIPLEEVKAVFPHGLPYRFQQQVLLGWFYHACCQQKIL
uniref:Small ribosomal subunit protein mS29 n=1 Tax=Anas platyrhynchos platyrhynchos TaxID=8840 RepID=A0A493SYB7_ANAPP